MGKLQMARRDESFVLKLKPVQGLSVALQADRVLPTMEGRPKQGLLPRSMAFEHDESSTIGRGGQSYLGIPTRARRMWLADEAGVGSTRP